MAARTTAAASACHDGRARCAPKTGGGLDTPEQAVRHCRGRQPLADQASQCGDPVALGGQRRIGGQAALHLDGVDGIELAVEIGVHQQIRIVVCCRYRHGASGPIVAIRRLRARANRDMTVPTGTPVISAISR